MTLRKTTSLTTLISFILLLVSSIVLYVTPQGKIAFWSNWKMLGLDKEQWGALHTNLGFLFLISGIIHIVLNWGPITAYLKNRAQQLKVFTADFNVAMSITLLLAAFTLLEWQPVHGIQLLNENLKDASATKYGEPPYGHAEVSPLESFCRRTGIEISTALSKLKAENLAGVTPAASLAEIAEANAMTPQQVYNLIKPEPGHGLPENPGSGLGRRTLEEICSTYGRDTAATIADLKSIGIDAESSLQMKELAERNNMDPHALYELMRGLD